MVPPPPPLSRHLLVLYFVFPWQRGIGTSTYSMFLWGVDRMRGVCVPAQLISS